MVIREISAGTGWGTRARSVLGHARPLLGRPGLAVLADEHGGGFLACDPVETSDAWVPPTGPPAPGWAGLPAAPRWIGAIPYEAGRDLERPGWTGVETRPPPSMTHPRWLRYDAVARVDGPTGRVILEADDERALGRLRAFLSERPVAARPIAVQEEPNPEKDDAHVARVVEVLRYIAAGDVYQVNVARALAFKTTGAALDIFMSFFEMAPSPYGFLLDFGDLTLCGASPELALSVRGDHVRTSPIKGTRPRGAHASEDLALAAALDADPKERAELTMAIDLHRNDLGRVCVPGSVRVLGPPRVVPGRTVWSRVGEIVGRRAPGTSLSDVVRALVPCGSVTGAPKVRAMEIIASLEPFRRGLYTGVYGYVGRDGGLDLAMAIRTLELMPQGRARYCAGGGIVADSDPWRELEETRWKAAQVAGLRRSSSNVLKLGRIAEVGVALEP